MDLPDRAHDSRQAPARQFPFALGVLAGGVTLILVGLGLLIAVRAVPALAMLGPAAAQWGVGALLLGVLGVVVGVGGLVLGWGAGTGTQLSRGSHRAVVASTLVPLILAIVAAVVFAALVPGAHEAQMPVFLVAGVVLYGSLMLVTYVQGFRTGLLSAESLGLRRELAGPAVLWGAGGAVITVGIGAANELVLQALGQPQPQHEAFTWLRGLPTGHFIAVAVGGALVAPVIEELFFRGYVFSAYLAEKGVRTAYIGSALIFGLVHGQLTLFPGIFAMGLVLAFLFRRSGSIIAPIVAHVLNNSLAFISMFAMFNEPRL